MEGDLISIKVLIGGRSYPLRIHWKNEEQVRKAAKLINTRLEKYMDKVSFKDHQDLLAFVALDFAVDSLKLEHKAIGNESEIATIVADLESLLASN